MIYNKFIHAKYNKLVTEDLIVGEIVIGKFVKLTFLCFSDPVPRIKSQFCTIPIISSLLLVQRSKCLSVK